MVCRSLTTTLKAKNRMDVDGAGERAEMLAAAIEAEIYRMYPFSAGRKEEYKSKYRSLQYNLKDSKNPGLLMRVVAEDLSARALCALTPQDLASPALKQWRKTVQETKLAEEVLLTAAEKAEAAPIGEGRAKVAAAAEDNEITTQQAAYQSAAAPVADKKPGPRSPPPPPP